MAIKKTLKVTIGLLSLLVVAGAALKAAGIEALPLPFASSAPTNSLTGLAGSDGPLLVVKLDDTTFAHPQVGLSSADVVYIEQVEGGLTRLAAVFSSSIPDLVGPVRSARISDIELLAQYGHIAFSYSGVQSKMLPVIASADLHDAGAMKYGAAFYSNDAARIPPYAMMVKAKTLLEKVTAERSNIATSRNMGWNFGDLAAPARTFSKVHISWPASSYDAKWSTSEKRWLLDHNGTPDYDDRNIQLGPKTLVIQLVSITNSIYHDKVGGITPFSATVGSGKCYILRDGGVIEGSWERSDATGGTRFTDAAGDEITFDRGQIWFALTAKEPVFTGLASQDATNTTTK